MRYGLIIMAVSLLTGCRKDDKPDKTETLPRESVSEKVMDSFFEYEWALSHSIEWRAFCNQGIMLNQHFKFQFDSFLISQEKVFYKLKKSANFDYVQGSHTMDWTELDGLYRYDFGNKKSLYYSDTSDLNPRLIMDFNLSAGDSFLLDSIFYGIYFVVSSVSTEMIDSVEMPKLNGVLSCNWLDYLSPVSFSLTPYYPNPFWIDLPLTEYYGYDWECENFGNDWYGGGGYIHSFVGSLHLTNDLGVVITSVGFNDTW